MYSASSHFLEVDTQSLCYNKEILYHKTGIHSNIMMVAIHI